MSPRQGAARNASPQATGDVMRRVAVLALTLGVVPLAQAGEERPLPPPPAVIHSLPIQQPELGGATAGTARAHSSNTIYVNRCRGGCTVSPGPDNAVNHTSGIPVRTGTLSEFAGTDDTWKQMMDCVRFVYAPYNVTITETDPSPAPHFEVLVAGTFDEIGQTSAGGFGVGACGNVTDNSISMAFANLPGADNAEWLCYVVAQETAHNFGLDHEMKAEDPMTYLPFSGTHLFQNADVPCGEDKNRNCCAGPATQNSDQYILHEFGPGLNATPEVVIDRPADGDTVAPGFAIEVGAGTFIDQVEVSVGGNVFAMSSAPPYIFNAPVDLPDGDVTLDVAVTDARGAVGHKTITVHQAGPSPCDGANPPPECTDPGGGGGGGGQSVGMIGGCHAGGAADGAGTALVLGIAWLAARRRRSR